LGKNNPRPVTTITNSLFLNNVASVASAGVNLQSPATLRNLTFINNTGVSGTGLAITCGGSSISNVIFRGNSASSQGGVISMSYGVVSGISFNTSFVNLVFDSNWALSGGAILSTFGSGIWKNCTFVNNSASTLAGNVIIEHFCLSCQRRNS
jgi:predicted outer membrane repeat protein